MGFDSLPNVPPLILPGGPEYAEYTLRRSREVAMSTALVLDVPYGREAFQKLDLYIPDAGKRQDMPVLMFIHGGAWSKGHKEWMGFMAPAILQTPAIFVSIDHRLVPHVRHPALVDDCCAALAWLSANIGRYGGSADKLFVGGHSSGGHLAALLTLRNKAGKPQAERTPRINGCVVISAPLNLDLRVAEGRRADLIHQFLADDNDHLDASPLHQTEGNEVPFFIAYGSEDLPEIITYSKSFIERLSREQGRVDSLVLDKMGHFDTNLACEDPNGALAIAMRELISRDT